MALLTYSVWDTPTFAAQAVRGPLDDLVLAYLGQQSGIVTPTTGVVSPGAGYTINVAAHTIVWQGTEQAVGALTNFSTGLAAQSTSDRKDLIQVSSTGTVSIVTGTPCGYTPAAWFEGCGFSAPVTPRPSASNVPVCELYVQGTYTTITTFTTGMITDKSGVWISPTSTTQGESDIRANQVPQLALPTTAVNLNSQRLTAIGAPQATTDVPDSTNRLLAVKYYEPGSTTTKVLAATALAAIDTTNLTLSFTAISTIVVVELEALVGQLSGTTLETLYFGLFTHSTTTQVGYTTSAAVATGTDATMRVRATIRITGLTALTAYQVDWAWGCSVATDDWVMPIGAATGTTAPAGPAIMRAFAG